MTAACFIYPLLHVVASRACREYGILIVDTLLNAGVLVCFIGVCGRTPIMAGSGLLVDPRASSRVFWIGMIMLIRLLRIGARAGPCEYGEDHDGVFHWHPFPMSSLAAAVGAQPFHHIWRCQPRVCIASPLGSVGCRRKRSKNVSRRTAAVRLVAWFRLGPSAALAGKGYTRLVSNSTRRTIAPPAFITNRPCPP
jgi:hypothetical protein